MFRAKISWVHTNDGGRKVSPSGGCRYAPIMVLSEFAKTIDWHHFTYVKEGLAWSVYFEIPPNGGCDIDYVDIHMVAEDLNLPNINNKLTSGTKFQLIEGGHVVAHGEVL